MMNTRSRLTGCLAVAADIRAVPGSVEVTKAALKHWKGQLLGMWTLLSRHAIISVLSTGKRGKAHTAKNRWGDMAEYRLVA